MISCQISQPSPPQPTKKTLEDQISEYAICQDIGIVPSGELHDLWTSKMAEAVTHIVRVEQPIHFDEIVRRLRDAWGIGRAGDRIRKSVMEGVAYAEKQGRIKKRGDFVWLSDATTVTIRRRTGDVPLKIEQICAEEIIEAVGLILKKQFATKLDELVTQTARLFGFQAVHQTTAHRIESIVKDQLRRGKLKRREDGMIEWPD